VNNGPVRITQPLLDVLDVLLAADGHELHGWAIMKTTNRAGPTVYKILERLSEAGLVVARWEELDPTANRPRRRFYRLTPNGVIRAQEILAGKRPDSGPRRFRLAISGGDA